MPFTGSESKELCVVFASKLIVAVANGKVEVVRLLLDKGVNVNATDNQGKTTLDITRYYKQKDIEALLLKAGAQVEEPPETLKMAKPQAKPNKKKSAAGTKNSGNK
jgi:ankyrin repeat protein